MKGNITELEVLTYATKHGIQVSIPFGDRERYDQVWDINGILYRIQVKTSRLADDNSCIIFSCRSNTKVQGKIRHSRYSKDEIDYFATYWNDKCYLVPIEECSTEKKLREQPEHNKTITTHSNNAVAFLIFIRLPSFQITNLHQQSMSRKSSSLHYQLTQLQVLLLTDPDLYQFQINQLQP